MSGITERLAAPGNHNERVRTYIEDVIGVAYSDVLQRVPTDEEVKEACEPRLLHLDGVVQLYLRLLCCSEFLSRFVFVLSPLQITRVLINQITGQAPTSAIDIETRAATLVSSGWCTFIQALMEEQRVRAHILGEMREVAARRGLSASERSEDKPRADPAPASPTPKAVRQLAANSRRTRARDLASRAP